MFLRLCPAESDILDWMGNDSPLTLSTQLQSQPSKQLKITKTGWPAFYLKPSKSLLFVLHSHTVALVWDGTRDRRGIKDAAGPLKHQKWGHHAQRNERFLFTTDSSNLCRFSALPHPPTGCLITPPPPPPPPHISTWQKQISPSVYFWLSVMPLIRTKKQCLLTATVWNMDLDHSPGVHTLMQFCESIYQNYW